MRLTDNEGSTYTNVKQGGGQIEYEDEDPRIHQEFEQSIRRAGAACHVGAFHPRCAYQSTAKVG